MRARKINNSVKLWNLIRNSISRSKSL